MRLKAVLVVLSAGFLASSRGKVARAVTETLQPDAFPPSGALGTMRSSIAVVHGIPADIMD
jgi:hypothetical protein